MHNSDRSPLGDRDNLDTSCFVQNFVYHHLYEGLRCFAINPRSRDHNTNIEANSIIFASYSRYCNRFGR